MCAVEHEGNLEGVSERGEQRSAAMACMAALTLVFSEYWLLNYSAFPLFDAVFIWTREQSACVGGAVRAAVAFAAFWRPQPLSGRLFVWGVCLAMVAGSAFCAVGSVTRFAAFAVLGASLVTVGSGLANICVGLSCVGLSARTSGVIVACAYVISFALRWVFGALPVWANLALFVCIPLASVTLCRQRLFSICGKLQHESPAEISITSPSSFVPFGHQLFISLVVFRFVYGYSLTFGEADRVPVVAFSALVPLCLVALVAVARRRALSPDGLFRVSLLLSVAGFLALSVGSASRDAVASALLSAGTGAFEILMYYVLIQLGSRNPVGALSAFAWGNAMASWGTIFGAVFGRMTNAACQNDAVLLSAIASCIVLALVAYMLFVVGEFRFSKTIEEVSPAPEVRVVERESSEQAFEDRLLQLAEDARLTEREREVFGLLARGRNARYIQETLVVSYNTVKTHVSHVYAKLGVHSQQELIDVVESGA